MERFTFITLSLLYSCLALAHSSYQIDLIIFAYPNQNNKLSIATPIISPSPNTLLLKTDTKPSKKPYRLLGPSHSSLQNEYYLLTRKGHFQVLGHYSWIQPSTNQDQVALPFMEEKGWKMQGTLNIQQNTYYSFAINLQLSPPDMPQESFTVSHKQRLKSNVIYYLDHAQIGMLVTIHQPHKT